MLNFELYFWLKTIDFERINKAFSEVTWQILNQPKQTFANKKSLKLYKQLGNNYVIV